MINISLINKIEKLIEEKIRPQLKSHYGDIKVDKFKEGILYITLLGQCSRCPSATLTVENVIKKQIIEQIPDVNDVILNTSVSGELLEMAKEILTKKKK